jgi:hypothetical protein
VVVADTVGPPWFVDAEHRIAESPKIERALLIWHEARLIMRRHPSLALVGFTSAIETLAPAGQQAPCRTCDNIPGATERFRVMIEGLIADDPNLEPARLVYKPRSRTAHAGHTHGTEATAGSVRYDETSPELEFERFQLPATGAAARLALWQTLKIDGAPPEPDDSFKAPYR